jgi:fluoroquinolone transport system permease protein
VAAPLVVILHQLLGVVSVPLGGLVLVAVAGLPTAPFMALLIAGFANNQVEGFAVMKATGFLIMAPLASFFIHPPWDLLVGIIPVFWPIKAYFALVDGSTDLFWLALVVSLVYPSLAVLALYRRFRGRAVVMS